ncbi:MAG: hypothetical protein ACERKT_00330 [Acidobacteriota bacterium]
MLLAAGAGLFLFYLMFRGWFNIQSSAPVSDEAVGVGMGRTFDAWVSFGWIDLYLMLTAVVTVTLPILAARRMRLPVKAGALLVALGAGAFILIAFRLLFPPWEGAGREPAPYLALLCAVTIVAGGHLSNLLVSGKFGKRPLARPTGRSGTAPPKTSQGRGGGG